MSRSRKKNPVVSDYSRNYTRYAKRFASRTVRYRKEHTDYGLMPAEIHNGCHFKRLYCSWNIFDYKWFVVLNEEPYIFRDGTVRYFGPNQNDVNKAYRK